MDTAERSYWSRRFALQPGIFLSLLSMSRIDLSGQLVFEPGWTDHRLELPEPLTVGWQLFTELDDQNAAILTQTYTQRVSLMQSTEATVAKWINEKLAYTNMEGVYLALCKEVYKRKKPPRWCAGLCHEQAIRAILACYGTANQQQKIRTKVSVRVYRDDWHHSKNKISMLYTDTHASNQRS